MKKLIAVSAVAALAATALSAEITFGSWLRVLAAPVASDGKDTVTTAGNSWGWGARTARFTVSGKAEDEKAGFNMGVYNDAFKKSIGDGDEANLWVKPLDIVKVSYGYYDNNTLRGDCCYGSWNLLRPVSSWIDGDEGLLMTGLSDKALGLLGEITPNENLYIQLFAPIGTEEKAEVTYKHLRAGLAYTIPGTAKIKAQYIGKGDVDDESTKDDESNNNCTIEAEVDVLAVENLFLGVGFQYNNVKDASDLAAVKLSKAETKAKEAFDAALAAAGTDAAKIKAATEAYAEAMMNANIDAMAKQMKIALGASYKINDQLKVSASGAFFTYYKIGDVKIDPRFQAGVGVDYDLGDGLAASADVRYLSPVKVDGEKGDKNYTDHIAFAAGIQKSVSSNGYIGVAFQGQTNSGNFATGDGAGVTGKDGDKFTWCIPVALSVWF